jgi:hypothetical protein
MPTYGERWRYGEAIATGVVESKVNQVISTRGVQKQMTWPRRGARVLLELRTRVRNLTSGRPSGDGIPACAVKR